MVERLTALLHDEAAGLEVPEVPTAAILRQGHSQRRRRRVAEALAGLAATGLLVAGVGTLVDGPNATVAQQRFASASAAAAYSDYGAFAAGHTVYVGNHRATLPEKVKAIYYTSAGVLVRTGEVAETDAAGPSHYTLVGPDGTKKSIDLQMGDRVPGTDPKSPNVAYAEPRDGYHGDRWDLVVVSLETGEEIARTEIRDAPFTWGGWEAPPADLHDNRMWVHLDAGWLEYDWTTGATRMVPGTARGVFEVAHGRYAVQTDGLWTVRDFAGGEALAAVPATEDDYAFFSPDGRYLRFWDQTDTATSSTDVRLLDVATGAVRSMTGQAEDGWTPNGRTLQVDPEKDRVTVCDPATGHCDRIDVQIGAGTVKLGGRSYES